MSGHSDACGRAGQGTRGLPRSTIRGHGRGQRGPGSGPGRRHAAADLCVIGLGYIGLPTAVVFAEAGLAVAGADIEPDTVAAVNAGRAPINEPGLDAALARAVGAGRLSAAAAPVPADAFIIAVPSPLGPARRPDLGAVRAAADALAPVLAPGNLVILETTVPPGTTGELAARLAAARPDLRVAGAGDEDRGEDRGGDAAVLVAHCPERVLPGRILAEVAGNDRIVGGLSPAAAAAAARLYGRVVTGRCHLTDARTAEAAKLAENAYRDVNIAFANELGLICARLGLDVRALIRLANRHPRVNILSPGPGVGGHCIAVDPWFLAAAAPDEAWLIRTARAVNDARPAQVAAEAAGMVAGLARPAIACLGLAYKADVGDMRESPAVEVTRRLAALNLGPVLAVEPHIGRLPEGLDGGGIELVGAGTALARADLVVLLVDHARFRDISPAALAGKRVLDTRGIWAGRVTHGLPLEAGPGASPVRPHAVIPAQAGIPGRARRGSRVRGNVEVLACAGMTAWGEGPPKR